MSKEEARKLWSATLGTLELLVPRATFDTFLRNTSAISLENRCIMVSAENAFKLEYIEQRLSETITSAISNITRDVTTVKYTVCGTPSIRKEEKERKNEISEFYGFKFNPRMTLQTFVTGDCNRMAYDMGKRTLSEYSPEFIPLYIYGATGMGKTHLLQATAQEAAAKGMRPLYVTGNNITNDCIAYARHNKKEQFNRKYHEADVLLIDEIEYIANKKNTELIFLNLLNELTIRGKRVILTGVAPIEISGLNSNLISRISEGLSISIGELDTSIKEDIAKKYSIRKSLILPTEVLEALIAEKFKNISMFIGSLNYLAAVSEMGEKVTADTVRKARAHVNVGDKNKTAPKPERVIETVAEATLTDTKDIIGRRRDKHISAARWATMFVLIEVCEMPTKKVGEILGGRNYQTVIHGYKKYRELVGKDENTKRVLAKIMRLLQ